jgi:hypothetical protein
MQAVSETLEKEWKENNIAIPSSSSTFRNRGDNGAFHFQNKNAGMIKGSKIIRDTRRRRFGLIMHIGVNGGKSKMEAM